MDTDTELNNLFRMPGPFNEGIKYSGKVKWQSPSNIALIKYWGKSGIQIPANPSISLTLSKSFTETEVRYSLNNKGNSVFHFLLDGKENEGFSDRLVKFLWSIEAYFPFLKHLDLNISSKNNFPHSSGIASSASGLSALALCLCSIEKKHVDNFRSEEDFFRKASFVSRLGSGSASRSVYGNIVSWGEVPGIIGTSDLFASKIQRKIHKDFQTYMDTILIIDSGVKKVSSTLGHSLMNNHPFALSRFDQAKKNYFSLIDSIENGDLNKFIEIVENEAMSLHAMMMTSNPWFMLMSPSTLKVITEIRKFREETNTPVCFTLDAGPNIHLLYPEKYSDSVNEFINFISSTDFVIQSIIFDQVGKGPSEIIE